VGQVVNIANGERITLNELLGELKSLTGKANVAADYREARAGDVKHSLAGHFPRARLLGFGAPCRLRTGLELTIDCGKTAALQSVVSPSFWNNAQPFEPALVSLPKPCKLVE